MAFDFGSAFGGALGGAAAGSALGPWGTLGGAVLGGVVGGMSGGGDNMPAPPPNPWGDVNDPNSLAYGMRSSMGQSQDMQSSLSTERTGVAGRGAPQADWTQYNDERNASRGVVQRQDVLGGALADAAYGEGGPSVAERQLYAGQAAATRNALSLANSARGGAQAQLAARQQAAYAGNQNMLTANQQAAQLRAGEQLAARQQYAQLLAQQQQAQLAQQQAEMSRQQFGVQTQLSQTGLNDAMARAYLSGELELQGGRQSALSAQMGQASGYSGDIYGSQLQAAAANRQARAQQQAAWVGAGATLGAGALSQRSGQAPATALATTPTPAPAPPPGNQMGPSNRYSSGLPYNF
jgi:hypothetical protein